MRIQLAAISFLAIGTCFSFVMAITKSALGDAPLQRVVRMGSDPALSPDGKQLVFEWGNELWIVPSHGGEARRLTNSPAIEKNPCFSPDGKQIGFVSDRTGSFQIYVMPEKGGIPEQKTFHSEGYELVDWFPNGESVLAIGQRDHFWKSAQRLMKIELKQRTAEKVLLDDAASEASLSPDGEKILFVREGERWWRKGYVGERSGQVWELNLKDSSTKEILHEGVECRWPQWMSDGRGFYYTKGDSDGFDLYRKRFARREGKKTPKDRKIADFPDDSIVQPTISRDGSAIVFRHLFDFYLYQPEHDEKPKRIDIHIASDTPLPEDLQRLSFNKADQACFTEDGLEIALVAGGDLWTMDTELREPIAITKTLGIESDPIFAPDSKSLWFTRSQDGQVDIWKVEPKQPKLFWWQQTEFVETKMTDSGVSKKDLVFTPNGKHLLFMQGIGDLVIMDVASKEIKTLVDGFSDVDFTISPDSKTIAYALQDDDFNSEIWMKPIDGSKAPVNVSRHPDNDRNPVFSPDGKLLAFTGRRVDTEVDIYYVYLQEKFDEKTPRDRRLEKAIEAMKKRKSSDEKGTKNEKKEASDEKSKEAKESEKKEPDKKDSDKKDPEKKDPDKKATDEEPISEVVIDYDKIHERVRRISLPDTDERNLLFSPDGKRLAFGASVDGKSGLYSVEFPDKLQPKLLSSTVPTGGRWSKAANGILGLNQGSPVKLEQGEKLIEYGFNAKQERSRSGRFLEGFNSAWLAMKSIWYDPAMGNRNWDAVRRKYVEAASWAHDERGLGEVIELMLGELNGSHLGFTPSVSTRTEEPDNTWTKPTAHLGVRFDSSFAGPGLKVRDVILGGPADRSESQLFAGDVILSIDGTPVDAAMDLTLVLNGTPDREIKLVVSRTNGNDAKDEVKEHTILLRPFSYARARALLYDHWLEQNRLAVEKQSAGRLGYLHIRAMDMGSFYEFERQLYNVGYGKEALVIDVRDNGGGSTTDHLLTALTQPRHAITIPRGGNIGYPHDRMVYATWSKPIIVLCNQNSYSNAEIFSHAIQVLGRGKLVGVQTAGGVVSTGATRINDVGVLRAPFRGWFHIKTGKDMELNGAKPDIVIWPKPGEMPKGVDTQLEAAVKQLIEDLKSAPELPKPRYATEDRK